MSNNGFLFDFKTNESKTLFKIRNNIPSKSLWSSDEEEINKKNENNKEIINMENETPNSPNFNLSRYT
jgi:hypothetical protein